MHFATVGPDVDGIARQELRRVEAANTWASGMTTTFGVLVGVAPKMLIDFLGSLAGRTLVHLLRTAAMRRRSEALVFRGLRDDLREVIVKTCIYPDEKLVSKADEQQRELEQLKRRVRDAAHRLRKINNDSAVAHAFDRYESELTKLQGAIYRYRLVAIGADGVAERTWEQDVEAGRVAFLEATGKLDDSLPMDIDPELLTLSMAVIQRSEESRKAPLH